MGEKCKQILKFLTRLIVTVGLLVWVFSRIDFGQFGEVVSKAHWGLVLAVWALTVIANWVLSAKMRLILKEQSCEVETATVFKASAISFLYSMVMPGTLSAGVKWFILKQQTGRGSNVLSSMVYNTLTEIVVITVLGLIALMAANPAGRWQVTAISAVLLVLITVVFLLSLSPAGTKINKLFHYILRPLPAVVRKGGETILAQIEIFQTVDSRFHFKIVLLTLAGSVFGGIVVFIFAAQAADIAVPLAVLVWQCAAVYLLSRLPISIANLGVREVTLVETMAVYGVAPSAAILMSMVIFSNTVLLAVLGAGYQIAWMLRTRGKTEKS